MEQIEQRVQKGVEAVERALLLLQCFEEPGEKLRLAVLAQRSALSKSTILRLIVTLTRRGFLHRDSLGLYILGPELKRLGALSLNEVSLADLIRPVLQQLSEAHQQTASLYVRDGDARICLFRHNSPRSARHHLEEGSRHPLGQGAASSILSAFGETPDPALGAVRRRGSAVSLGGRDPDLAAVAVPLFNGDGDLIGALNVSGLIGHFTEEKVAEFRAALLQATADLKPRLPPLSHVQRLTSSGLASR